MTSLTKKLLITAGFVTALGLGGAAFADGHGQSRHGGGMPGMGMMRGMMFWFMDRNEDGFVDTAEIDKFRTKMFERHDPNNDGIVTREEMRESHAMMRGGMGGQGRHGGAQGGDHNGGQGGGGMFERLDADSNGEISLAEFLASEPRMFSRADADGDGRVSQAEMDEMHANRREWQQRHHQWHQDNNMHGDDN